MANETFYSRHPNPNSLTAPSDTSVQVRAGSTRILPYAFNGNTVLQSVTIPASVETIGRYAFLGTTALRYITNHSSNPQQIDSRTFAGVNRASVQLNVPTGTRQAFINAGWSGFNIVEPPSVITNAHHFALHLGKMPFGNFILGANIDLSIFDQWMPIHTFSGILDGNGHTISGMNITRPGQTIANDTHLGLISNLTGTVRNLTITNSTINIASNHTGNGWLRAGILAGSVWQVGVVDNVRINSSYVTVHRERSSIGGLAGEVRGRVNNSMVASVGIWGNGDIGGISGSVHAAGSIHNSRTGVILRHYHYRNNRSIGGISGFHGAGVGVIHDNEVRNTIIRRENFPGNPNIGVIIGDSADPTRETGNTFSNFTLSVLDENGVRTNMTMLPPGWGLPGRPPIIIFSFSSCPPCDRVGDISLLCERCSQKDPVDVCANCAECIAFREWYMYVNGIPSGQRGQVA